MINKMNLHIFLKYLFTLLTFVLVIGVFSCKTSKRIIQADTELEDKTSSELFSDVLKKEINFDTFSTKLNMTVSTGTKTLSSKGSLRIVKDEAIQLSVQPLFGIEMFRLHITPNHIIVLDRMNKRYVKESFNEVSEMNPIGFNFYTLQSLFTNKLFIPEQSTVAAKDYKTFRYSDSDDNYELTSRDKRSDIDYSFFVNGNDQITLTKLCMPAKDYALNWKYNQFSLMESLFFPYEMDIAATTPNHNLNTSLSFSSISLNEPLSIETSIPRSYTRVKLKDILKILEDKK